MYTICVEGGGIILPKHSSVNAGARSRAAEALRRVGRARGSGSLDCTSLNAASSERPPEHIPSFSVPLSPSVSAVSHKSA